MLDRFFRGAVAALALVACFALVTMESPRTTIVYADGPTLTKTLSATTCPGIGCFVVDVSGRGTVGIQVTGTFVGTLQFEQTVDGTNYTTIAMFPNGSTTSVTSATATGLWSASTTTRYVRVRFSAYTSGSAVINVVTTQAKAGGGGATVNDTGVVFSDVTSGNATSSQHGFLPKLSGTVGDVFTGAGTFVTDMCRTDTCTSATYASTFGLTADGLWKFQKSSAGNGFQLKAQGASATQLFNATGSNSTFDTAGYALGTIVIARTGPMTITTGGGSPSPQGGSDQAYETIVNGSPASTMVFAANWGSVAGLNPQNWYRITCSDLTTTSIYADQSAATSTTATVIWYSRTTGLATAPTTGDKIICSMFGG